MKQKATQQARRILDSNLQGFGSGLHVPRDGWIRAIRESLGMTRAQLGARMDSARLAKRGISASAVQAMERQEAKGTISIDTLERAARAMDCHLVYALVPNSSLQNTVEKQAALLAADAAARTERTMALEDQTSQLSPEHTNVSDLVGTPALWR